MTPRKLPKRTIPEELELLRDAVEALTGLPSRWSGNVVLLDSAQIVALRGRPVFAQKLWACDILVNADVVEAPMRWRTYLHEMWHSVSVGTNGVQSMDYRRFLGWEEGVVEWWQRHLRSQVLEWANIHVPEEIFVATEAVWTYNRHLEALEVLQQAVGVPKEAFYNDLLRMPLAQRCFISRHSKVHRIIAVCSQA